MTRHIDKIFLALCVAACVTVAVAAPSEEPRLASLVQTARQVRAETERAHPRWHPAPLAPIARPWDQAVADFRADGWVASYGTELEKNILVRDEPPPVLHFPKLFDVQVSSDMDKVTLRAQTKMWPGKTEAIDFQSVQLERRQGAEWRILKIFDPKQDAFEFVDADVVPRHEYAYRWVGLPKRPAKGVLAGEKVTTLEKTVQRPDIWKIKVKFIFRDPQTKVLTAFLDLEKYEKSRATWFKKKECKVPMEPGYRIGGVSTITNPGDVVWNFDELGVNYDTGLTLKSMDEAKQQIVVVDSDKQERAIGR